MMTNIFVELNFLHYEFPTHRSTLQITFLRRFINILIIFYNHMQIHIFITPLVGYFGFDNFIFCYILCISYMASICLCMKIDDYKYQLMDKYFAARHVWQIN